MFPPWRLWPQKLIVIGFQHSVIYFAVFVRFSSNVPLRILIGSDQIHGPLVQMSETLADLLIEPGKFRLFLQTLSIGRVGDHEAIGLRMAEILHGTLLEVDQPVHAR